MESQPTFHQMQIQAIQKLYRVLLLKSKKPISMTDAIITWFAEGYAEKFREEYLRKQSAYS